MRASRFLISFQRLASRPYVFGFVAVMADAHVAEGVAVGSVFATEHMLVPGALENDLGCGMSAIETEADANPLDYRTLEAILRAPRPAIPTGAATHRDRSAPVPEDVFARRLSTHPLEHAARRWQPCRGLWTLAAQIVPSSFRGLSKSSETSSIDLSLGEWTFTTTSSRKRNGSAAIFWCIEKELTGISWRF